MSLSEMAVDFELSTQRYTPEDGILYNGPCENLES
jgi:hypothetical protein